MLVGNPKLAVTFWLVVAGFVPLGMLTLDSSPRLAPTRAQCTSSLAAVSDALDAIGGKWKLRIIIALSAGHSRFNELQRVLQSISARVLSNELKELEQTGFVKRTVHTEAPVVVEYSLTPYSNTLSGVVEALSAWGEQHQMRAAQ